MNTNGSRYKGAKLPQLRMRFDMYEELPDVELPVGYTLHTLAERGEEEWIEALNATGDLGVWDQSRARDWLSGDRPVVPEGSYIIMFEGRPVATACIVGPTLEEPCAEVGWVSVSPDHQGNGLGYQATLATLLYAKSMGYPEARLNTDDWRLAAIKTYVKLGFEPVIERGSHPRRWKAVFDKLGIASPILPDRDPYEDRITRARNRRTLERLFAEPPPDDIRGPHVAAMLQAAGVEVSMGTGSRVRLLKGSDAMVIHRPDESPKTGVPTALAIAKFLRAVGIEP